jgi:hypothetical protein
MGGKSKSSATNGVNATTNRSNGPIVTASSQRVVVHTQEECIDEAVRMAGEMGRAVHCMNQTHCVRLVGVLKNPKEQNPEHIPGGTTEIPKGMRIMRVCCGLYGPDGVSRIAKKDLMRNLEQSGCHVCVECFNAEQYKLPTKSGELCRSCEVKRPQISDSYDRTMAATSWLSKGPYPCVEIEQLRDRLYDLRDTLNEGAALKESAQSEGAAVSGSGEKDTARRHAIDEARKGNKGPLRDLQQQHNQITSEAEAAAKRIDELNKEIDALPSESATTQKAAKESLEQELTGLEIRKTRARTALENAAEENYERIHGDDTWSDLNMEEQESAIADLMRLEEEHASRPDPATAKPAPKRSRPSKVSKSKPKDAGAKKTIAKPKHVVYDADDLKKAKLKHTERVQGRIVRHRSSRIDVVRNHRKLLYRELYLEELRVNCVIETMKTMLDGKLHQTEIDAITSKLADLQEADEDVVLGHAKKKFATSQVFLKEFEKKVDWKQSSYYEEYPSEDEDEENPMWHKDPNGKADPPPMLEEDYDRSQQAGSSTDV